MNTQEIFNQTRHQVLNSFPSIFTREDVILLLFKLEESVEAVEKPATSVFTPELKNRILQVVKEAIDESAENLESGDVVDFDSAEFSMNGYNTVELDSVNIANDDIAREMKREVCDSLNTLFEEIESKEELPESEKV